jgi:hypothetical protein
LAVERELTVWAASSNLIVLSGVAGHRAWAVRTVSARDSVVWLRVGLNRPSSGGVAHDDGTGTLSENAGRSAGGGEEKKGFGGVHFDVNDNKVFDNDSDCRIEVWKGQRKNELANN